MLDAPGYPAVVRLFRTLLAFKLGFWAGMVLAGQLVKRAVPSRGDSDSDEVSLVAVFNGIDLKSKAETFRGGSMFAWFGGIAVDLRDATIAPEGAHLDLHTLQGGIAVRIPLGWRVQSDLKALAGGVDVSTPEPEDPNAPTLTISGFAALGGIAVGAKSDDAPPES
jgi:hypothetical protein